MARLAKLLHADIPTLAKALQRKGRRGDTILAHINPREAALLKARGGSASTNPETGLLEFFDGELDFEPAVTSPVAEPQVTQTEVPVSAPAQDFSSGAQQPVSAIGEQPAFITQGATDIGGVPGAVAQPYSLKIGRAHV